MSAASSVVKTAGGFSPAAIAVTAFVIVIVVSIASYVVYTNMTSTSPSPDTTSGTTESTDTESSTYELDTSSTGGGTSNGYSLYMNDNGVPYPDGDATAIYVPPPSSSYNTTLSPPPAPTYSLSSDSTTPPAPAPAPTTSTAPPPPPPAPAAASEFSASSTPDSGGEEITSFMPSFNIMAPAPSTETSSSMTIIGSTETESIAPSSSSMTIIGSTDTLKTIAPEDTLKSTEPVSFACANYTGTSCATGSGPVIAIDKKDQSGAMGGTVNYNVSITNTNGCGCKSSSMSIVCQLATSTGSKPTGWTFEWTRKTTGETVSNGAYMTFLPQETLVFGLAVTSAISSSASKVTISVSSYDATVSKKTGTNSATYTILQKDPVPPTSSAGSTDPIATVPVYNPPLRPTMNTQTLYADTKMGSIRYTGSTETPSTIEFQAVSSPENKYMIKMAGLYLRSDYGLLSLNTNYATPYEQYHWYLEQSSSTGSWAVYNSWTSSMKTTRYYLFMNTSGQLATTSNTNLTDTYSIYRWAITGIQYQIPVDPAPSEPTGPVQAITKEYTVKALADLASAAFNAANVATKWTKEYDMGVVVDDDSADISFVYKKNGTFTHIDSRRYNYKRDPTGKVVYSDNDGRNSGSLALPSQITSQYTVDELWAIAKLYYLNNGGAFANFKRGNPIDPTTVDYMFEDASKGLQFRRYTFGRSSTFNVMVKTQGAQDSATTLLQYKPAVQEPPAFGAGQNIYALTTLYGGYLADGGTDAQGNNKVTSDITKAYRMAMIRVNPDISGDKWYYLVDPSGQYFWSFSNTIRLSPESGSNTRWYIENGKTASGVEYIKSALNNGTYLVSWSNGALWGLVQYPGTQYTTMWNLIKVATT